MALDLLAQTMEQGKKLETLVSKAARAQASFKEASDRVFYSLQDDFTFLQGQNTVQNLVFNVPHSDDFEAVRFSVYPFIRLVQSEDPFGAGTYFAANDRTFRATTWTVQRLPIVTYGLDVSVDVLIELASAAPDGKTRRHQNAAFFVSQTFSSYTSLAATGRSESPSALCFDPCWLLAKGSAVTARITPIYSGERDPAFVAVDGLIFQYQIRGVIEGYKRVR